MDSAKGDGAQSRAGEMSILLTNDDGIEDYQRRLMPLARSLAVNARVTVVVSGQDCSGSSHYTSIGLRKRALESTLVHTSPEGDGLGRIEVHSVEGFPADCVFLALRGILLDDPPDVVVSGLNGGPNLGGSWLHSGTVGAARVAANSGIPAVAVSGVDFRSDEDIERIAQWLGRLIRGPIIRGLEAGQFVTLGIPRGRLDDIQGIRLAPRAPSLGAVEFERAGEVVSPAEVPQRSVWLMQPPKELADPPAGSDVDLYRQGFIVVTPMHADEHAPALMDAWAERFPEFPPWEG